METQIKNQLLDLKLNLSNVQNQINDLRAREKELKTDILKLETGINIGDKITLKGKSGVISNIIYEYNEPKFVAKFYRKDGSLGALEKRLYSWVLNAIKKATE
jgi:hypothetical protein